MTDSFLLAVASQRSDRGGVISPTLGTCFPDTILVIEFQVIETIEFAHQLVQLTLRDLRLNLALSLYEILPFENDLAIVKNRDLVSRTSAEANRPLERDHGNGH